MLASCKQILEYNSAAVAIHPRFIKLITVLRTAIENGKGSLDENQLHMMTYLCIQPVLERNVCITLLISSGYCDGNA